MDDPGPPLHGTPDQTRPCSLIHGSSAERHTGTVIDWWWRVGTSHLVCRQYGAHSAHCPCRHGTCPTCFHTSSTQSINCVPARSLNNSTSDTTSMTSTEFRPSPLQPLLLDRVWPFWIRAIRQRHNTRMTLLNISQFFYKNKTTGLEDLIYQRFRWLSQRLLDFSHKVACLHYTVTCSCRVTSVSINSSSDSLPSVLWPGADPGFWNGGHWSSAEGASFEARFRGGGPRAPCSPPSGSTPGFDTVGWVIWPVKPVPDMTCNVFGGTLNLVQSINQFSFFANRHTDTRTEGEQ